jgi:hypothetical protein
MVGVTRAVDYPNVWHGAHGLNQRIDLRQVTPLGKIWHAFNQAIHGPGGLAQGGWL